MWIPRRPTPIAILFAIVALVSVPALAADPLLEEAAALRDEALAGTGAYDLVADLVRTAGPRFAGSPGDALGVGWAEEAMRELGFQNVRREPVEVPRWERGTASAAIVAPARMPLVVVALGGSVGTPAGGVEAEVVRVEDLDELASLADAAVSGRIVYFARRMPRERSGRGYGTTVAPRGAGPAAAAKKGAVAMLLRSVGTSEHRFGHTGGTRYEEGVARIPAVALPHVDADQLEHWLARGAVRVRLELTSRDLGTAQSFNVVGEVPGSERSEEIVVLGAHLDSWDLGEGAVDDGAGCAIVLETARQLMAAPRPPRRTVRVVLFANEEFGLSGARAYAAAHADELENHVFAIESDLGADRVWRYASFVQPELEETMKSLLPVLEPLGIEWTGNDAFGGADLRPLREAHVPVADLTQDASRYFDLHHTADDTLDKIDAAQLDQNVAAFVAVTHWVANREGTLGRAPDVPERRRR